MSINWDIRLFDGAFARVHEEEVRKSQSLDWIDDVSDADLEAHCAELFTATLLSAKRRPLVLDTGWIGLGNRVRRLHPDKKLGEADVGRDIDGKTRWIRVGALGSIIEIRPGWKAHPALKDDNDTEAYAVVRWAADDGYYDKWCIHPSEEGRRWERVDFPATFIRQPEQTNLCGPCCIGMILGLSLEEAVSLVGKNGLTGTRHLRAALEKSGWSMGPRINTEKINPEPGQTYLARVHWGEGKTKTHWVLVNARGEIIDPAHGFSPDEHGIWPKSSHLTSLYEVAPVDAR